MSHLEHEYDAGVYYVGIKPPASGKVSSFRAFSRYMKSPEALSDPRPNYLWDDAIAHQLIETGRRHLIEDTEVPAVVAGLNRAIPEKIRCLSATVTMGPACTGSHFHSHNHAFCTLVAGLKYWIMLSPEAQLMQPHPVHQDDLMSMHPRDYIRALQAVRGSEWWRTQTPGMSECTQQPGDFLFVPNGYAHMVLNLWPSAAVNHEFRQDGQPEKADPFDKEAAREASEAEAWQKQLKSLAGRGEEMALCTRHADCAAQFFCAAAGTGTSICVPLGECQADHDAVDGKCPGVAAGRAEEL